MASPVSYALDGEVAVITIDNPPVNALSHAVREGLLKSVERFQGDSKAKAAVLAATGLELHVLSHEQEALLTVLGCVLLGTLLPAGGRAAEPDQESPCALSPARRSSSLVASSDSWPCSPAARAATTTTSSC